MAHLREMIIISSPRNGTNFYCECVRQIEGALGLFEIFNPSAVFGVREPPLLAHFAEALGHDIDGARDKRLVAFFRQDPLQAVNLLRSYADAQGASLISYKVFPRQLPPEQLSALMARENVSVSFLTRRRLDVYVSYCKAQTHKSWANQDTTDLRVTVDADAFLEWSKANDAWFADRLADVTALGLPYRIWDYGQDVNVGKAALMQELALHLADLGTGAKLPDQIRKPGFIRQDKAARPFDRVENGAELRAALHAAKQLRYALGTPLIGDDAQPGVAA